MKLNFDSYGVEQAGEPLVILHGLFGSATNWRSLARRFAEQRPVYCLDLRNHGASPHAETMRYSEMADDVLEFLDDRGLPRATVLGHSLGGKVAMQLALAHPERVAHLIVADMAPKRYKGSHEEIFRALDAVTQGRPTTRQEAEALMEPIIAEQGIRWFLLTNLEPAGDGTLRWRINVEGIRAEYDRMLEVPASPHHGDVYEGPTLFVHGGASRYIKDEDVPRIKALFPEARLVMLEGAGHWLHADAPGAFQAAVESFLEEA